MNVFRAISFCCFLLTGISCSPPHLKPCEYPIDSARRAVVSISAGGAWAEVDRLQVSEWKPRYFAEDIGLQVYDGTQWWMIYQTHSTKRETSGDNAYPKIGAPRTVTLDNKAFDDLFDAFASLFPTSMKNFEK